VFDENMQQSISRQTINSFVNNLKGGGYYVLELEAEWFYE
jgi:biotin operon repressor